MRYINKPNIKMIESKTLIELDIRAGVYTGKYCYHVEPALYLS